MQQRRISDTDPKTAAIIAELRRNEDRVMTTIAQGRALLAILKSRVAS